MPSLSSHRKYFDLAPHVPQALANRLNRHPQLAPLPSLEARAAELRRWTGRSLSTCKAVLSGKPAAKDLWLGFAGLVGGLAAVYAECARIRGQ
ncbi:hypothetical protein LNKW23_18220 [Paralimibaculum aggregatum]|uniref:Uncharacterized protein n=1 Tax=Paralimibaculum aggregatum TaxID=3036245 RepID=A0ABQ6LH39_9RHOB|nr:hypothetical protein [Limibaculum sp. NKW23]GMG82609.1 hypothetical protein LNKW23_18220 [Limibaculum sp. NKW23]